MYARYSVFFSNYEKRIILLDNETPIVYNMFTKSQKEIKNEFHELNESPKFISLQFVLIFLCVCNKKIF
jgi:hypothetical protein